MIRIKILLGKGLCKMSNQINSSKGIQPPLCVKEAEIVKKAFELIKETKSYSEMDLAIKFGGLSGRATTRIKNQLLSNYPNIEFKKKRFWYIILANQETLD